MGLSRIFDLLGGVLIRVRLCLIAYIISPTHYLSYLSQTMNYETVPFIIPALATVYLVAVYLLLMFVQRSRA